MADAKALPLRDVLRYAALALPLSFAGIPLYIHAPDFYATQLGISLSLIGVVLLGLRLIDAVQDPLIGYFSDRFAASRYPLIVVSGCVLVAGFFGLFHPPGQHYLVWFAAMMVLTTTAFSVLSINVNTIGGLWSRDAHQKTRITSCREAMGLVGLLVAVMLPAILQQSMPPEAVFKWVSLVLCMFMAGGLMLFSWWVRSHPIAHNEAPRERASIWRDIRTMPAATRRFFAVYGVSMLASSIPGLLILFFVRDRLQAEAYTGLFLALYFVAGALGMPLWHILSKRFGKYRSWAASMALAIVSFVWAFVLGEGDIWQFGVICVVSGVAFGADLAMPPSILADHIQQHDQQASASLRFSVLAFLLKASLALASAMVFPLLDAAGFVPGGTNSAQALFALSIVYALVPCVIKLLAVWLLWRSYPLFD